MQSKGRARAKQNASYVLFMDESNTGARKRDTDEYQDYEEIEKVCCLFMTNHIKQIYSKA